MTQILNSSGMRIKAVRGALGVGEFAEKLGVNRKTVTRWEADEALPDGVSLLALMRKFGADPAWVLDGTGIAPLLAPREAALLDNYRAASEDGKRAVEATSAALAQPSKKKA